MALTLAALIDKKGTVPNVLTGLMQVLVNTRLALELNKSPFVCKRVSHQKRPSSSETNAG